MIGVSLPQLAGVAAAATVSGAVNAIAGGGTLLTFPALIALGIDPIAANATSTVALWPGSLSSMYGYRRMLGNIRQWAIALAAPSLLGGGVGAWLLLHTSAQRFAQLAPWLVLGATVLFAAQGTLTRFARSRSHAGAGAAHGELVTSSESSESSERIPLHYLFFQFLLGIYGGYFGAGVGILMLAALGLMGFTNINRMNGLKNWGGLCMNLVAAIAFAFTRLVNWPVALTMAVGAVAGGYGASRMAQRVPQAIVRRAILVIGFVSALWLLAQQLGA